MPGVGANNHCKPNMNLILPFQSGRGHQDIAQTQTKRIFFTLLSALHTRLEICSFLVSLCHLKEQKQRVIFQNRNKEEHVMWSLMGQHTGIMWN